VGKQGDRRLAEEEALQKILIDLEKTIKRRLIIAAKRSPETFLEEAEALELIIDLRKKLAEG
jgi:hypothetical protein